MDQARHRPSTSAGTPRCSARRGTTRPARGRCAIARRRRHRGRRSTRPRGDLARSASSTARTSPTSPGATRSPARRSTPPAGTTTSTSPGKRVAMIGAGASGFQIAPDDRRPTSPQLTVFQRTAQWMFPNPNYHETGRAGRAVGAAPPAVLRPLVPVPDLLARLRQGPRGRASSTPTSRTSRPPSARSTTSPARCSPTGSPSQVGDDPDLLAKVVPDYPATGKRTLQDNGSWLRTLTRDNVELVRTGIDHIEPDAVVTVDGDRHDADVIVYATGFQRQRRAVADGDRSAATAIELASDVGRAGPPAYLGITVPELPELLLHVRPGHQPRARRQPDLPLRVPDALHHGRAWTC